LYSEMAIRMPSKSWAGGQMRIFFRGRDRIKSGSRGRSASRLRRSSMNITSGTADQYRPRLLHTLASTMRSSKKHRSSGTGMQASGSSSRDQIEGASLLIHRRWGFGRSGNRVGGTYGASGLVGRMVRKTFTSRTVLAHRLHQIHAGGAQRRYAARGGTRCNENKSRRGEGRSVERTHAKQQ